MAADPAPGLRRRARLQRLRRLGLVFHGLSTATACAVVGLAAAFVALLWIDAEASIRQFGGSFLFSSDWSVTTNAYGAAPAILGTLLTSGLALLLATPVALGVAIFSSEIAPGRIRGALSVLVDLGATIPSIVYGYWAFFVLVPIMRDWVEPSLALTTSGRGPFSGLALGFDYLTASVILAIMIIPTIAALSREAFRLVPRAQREGALALGANRWEATRIAVFGPARPAILGATMVGLGRAIGETVAVSLVIGNSLFLPTSLFSPGTTIPSLLVGTFSGATGLELSALIELGLILFGISFAINVIARVLLRSGQSARTSRAKRVRSPHPADPAAVGPGPTGSGFVARSWWGPVARRRSARIRQRRVVYYVLLALLVGALVISVAPLLSILYTAGTRGGAVVLRPSFYTSEPPPACITNCTLGGIGPAIEGTGILLGVASAVAIPVGLLTGIYLSEYGRHRIGRAIGLIVDVMTGIPSILIGIFVFAIFLDLDRTNPTNALAGALALAILMVPIVARATFSALATVPQSAREAALALGFPRHRVTLRVVLGSCQGAIVTGILLAIGRAGGEVAALFLTTGYTTSWFSGLNRPALALAPFIYNSLTDAAYPNWQTDAWGAVLVLLLIMVALSLLARYFLQGRGAVELS